LLIVFLALSVIGLILSLITHTAALLGLPQPFGPAAWALHLGIFVVFLPAMILSNRQSGDSGRKVSWEEALRGCPAWMRLLTFGFFCYAVVNFLLFIPFAPPRGAPRGPDAPPVVFRGFSGHWMAFYSAAAATLYSALVVSRTGRARRCPNGHPVPPPALHCEVCGRSVIEHATERWGDGTGLSGSTPTTSAIRPPPPDSDPRSAVSSRIDNNH
jgi:hypothetical protein